jgi:hypothetical protein
MLNYLRRVALAVVVALTVMVVTMPIGQAQSNPGQAQYNFEHQVKGPDVSTQAAAELYFKEHPVNTAAAEEIRASITLTKDGFATSNPKFVRSVNEVNAGLRQYRAAQTQAKPLLGAMQAQAWWCLYIPGWMFHAYIYTLVLEGGIFATVALFMATSIAGIPLAAVLGALGIWYGIAAYYLDQIFAWRGYYDHGAWVCIS